MQSPWHHLVAPQVAMAPCLRTTAINARNRHAENDQMQHYIHGDRVDMHHAWEIKARGNPPLKLVSGALPQPVAELAKH